MVQNIFVGLLGALVVAAGIWGWWIENGREAQENTDDTGDADAQGNTTAGEQIRQFSDSENKKAM